MPTDYYSDTDDTDSADMDLEDVEESKTDKGAATALLPKNFFPNDKELKPGNVCKVKVARVLDDQVEVTYLRENKPESETVESPDEVGQMMA